jgi:hypothetical protein
MKHILLLAGLLATCMSAGAAEERMHLVQPNGGGLALVQLERENNLFAKFSGQTWVTGTFVGHWPGGTKSKATTPEYLLVPDKSSSAGLPYFVLKEPPYFHRYLVDAIDVENGETTLHMVISQEKADRLLKRKVDAVRATGRFLVENFIVGVECDAPWARAVLVKAQLPSQVAVLHQTVPERC